MKIITDSNNLKCKIYWVCFDCGKKAGKVRSICCACHEGVCDVCGEHKTLTNVRDFGYPDFKYVGKFKVKALAKIAELKGEK